MSRASFLLIFAGITILDLYQVYFEGNYRDFTKPLIMLSLMIYYIGCYPKLNWQKPRVIFSIALFFALAGDVFLLFDNMFLAGLGSFLVMQVLYSYCFLLDRSRHGFSKYYGLILMAIIGFAAYMLWGHLGKLRLPVIIYMTAISAMSYLAYNRNPDLKGYWMVFVGTLFFMISDTVLAIHQFDIGLDLGTLTVMLTYSVSQYLIVQGYIDGALKV